MNRIFVIIAICITLFFSAHPVMAIDLEEDLLKENLADIADYTLKYFADTMLTTSYDQFEDYAAKGNTVVSKVFDNEWLYRWKAFSTQHGKVVDAQVERTYLSSDDYYISSITLTGEDSYEMELSFIYTKTMIPLSVKLHEQNQDPLHNSSTVKQTLILGEPALYSGGPYKLVLVTGKESGTFTTIEEGEGPISFPYLISTVLDNDHEERQIYLYEKVDGKYNLRASWSIEDIEVVMPDNIDTTTDDKQNESKDNKSISKN